jgi:hypothetical protein
MLMLRRPHDRQAPRRHRFESEQAMRRGGEALNAVPEAGTHLDRVRRGPGARARLSIVPRLAFGPTCTAQSDVRIHRPQAEDGARCRGERAPRPPARPEPTPGRILELLRSHLRAEGFDDIEMAVLVSAEPAGHRSSIPSCGGSQTVRGRSSARRRPHRARSALHVRAVYGSGVCRIANAWRHSRPGRFDGTHKRALT